MDIVFHLTVPFLLLLALGANKRHAIALLPLTVLPDLGRFVLLRKGLHSIFFVLLIIGILTALTYALKKQSHVKSVAMISSFYLLSHLLLDLGGFMALLYPLSTETFALHVKVVLVNLLPVFLLSIETGGLTELEQGSGIVLSEQGFGMLILTATALAYIAKKQNKERVKKND